MLNWPLLAVVAGPVGEDENSVAGDARSPRGRCRLRAAVEAEPPALDARSDRRARPRADLGHRPVKGLLRPSPSCASPPGAAAYDTSEPVGASTIARPRPLVLLISENGLLRQASRMTMRLLLGTDARAFITSASRVACSGTSASRWMLASTGTR